MQFVAPSYEIRNDVCTNVARLFFFIVNRRLIVAEQHRRNVNVPVLCTQWTLQHGRTDENNRRILVTNNSFANIHSSKYIFSIRPLIDNIANVSRYWSMCVTWKEWVRHRSSQMFSYGNDVKHCIDTRHLIHTLIAYLRQITFNFEHQHNIRVILSVSLTHFFFRFFSTDWTSWDHILLWQSVECLWLGSSVYERDTR